MGLGPLLPRPEHEPEQLGKPAVAPGARLSLHRWGCSTGHYQALTYIEVISLARDALMDCAEEFPEAARRIRAACVRILMAKLLTKHLRSVLAPQNARRSMSVINRLSLEDQMTSAGERKLQRARATSVSASADDAALNEVVRSAVSSALREALPEGSLQALSAELASLRAALASQSKRASNDVPLPADRPERGVVGTGRQGRRPSPLQLSSAGHHFATPADVDPMGC